MAGGVEVTRGLELAEGVVVAGGVRVSGGVTVTRGLGVWGRQGRHTRAWDDPWWSAGGRCDGLWRRSDGGLWRTGSDDGS